jgi:hypothetical protein
MNPVLISMLLLLGSDVPAAGGPPGSAQDVEAILTRLEERGNGIKDLRCKVEYTIEDKINLDELTKNGSISFRRAEPHEVFLILFDKLVQAGIKTTKKEWYLFKGRWLWEAKESTKSIIKREIVRPGEKVDLFDLESAPFPIPFGQKKDQILRNFDVKLVPPAAGDPAGTDHLLCIPKPGAALSRDYEKLEFFVSRELHLPVKVVATELGGKKVTTAVFPDLTKDSINAGLSDKDFDEPGEWKKYGTVEEPLPAKMPDPGQ